MNLDENVCEQDNLLIPPFALDSASGTALPEELELFLAWRLVEQKRSNNSSNRFYSGGIDALVKAYYPLWVVPFDGRIALIDPVVSQPSTIEYRENPSVESFIDHLQTAHSKRSVFRNILMVHQNTFASSESSKNLLIQGLIKKPDVTPIVEYVAKSGCVVSAESIRELCIGDLSYNVIADEVSELTAIVNTFAEGLKHLELALTVLETETSHQIRELKAEIEGIKSEYTHEIDSTKEILRQSVNKLVKRRDAEVEIAASRFSEIKDILTSDISNFKKVQASLFREGGYLSKMVDVRVVADQSTSSRLIKKLLGDHPQRLKMLENEVEKIQHLMKLVEMEKSRQLAAIEDLYDELIKAKSRIASDLKIDLDIEVNKRLAELDELSEMQMALREKIRSLIETTVSQFEKTDWLVPNSLNISEASIILIPIYIAYCPRRKREDMFVIYGPGFFSQGLSPTGRAYKLEDRFRPLSYQSKALFEASLSAKLRKSNRIQKQIVRLAVEKGSFSSLAPVAKKGLKMAYDNGWVSQGVYHALENKLKQSMLVKPLQST